MNYNDKRQPNKRVWYQYTIELWSEAPGFYQYKLQIVLITGLYPGPGTFMRDQASLKAFKSR